MKLTSVESLNPTQRAFCLVTTPKNIRTIELILYDKDYGSGTKEFWEKQLSDLKTWYEKLKEYDLTVGTKLSQPSKELRRTE